MRCRYEEKISGMRRRRRSAARTGAGPLRVALLTPSSLTLMMSDTLSRHVPNDLSRNSQKA